MYSACHRRVTQVISLEDVLIIANVQKKITWQYQKVSPRNGSKCDFMKGQLSK